jgi:small subunit ribosomal protein S4
MRSNSRYGIQLMEKQKLRRYCNISEKQFSNIIARASQRLGNTADNIVDALERRIDMILYRANFAPTIFAARQLVSHKHVTVNGRRVKTRSIELKDGDIVALSVSGKNLDCVQSSLKSASRRLPDYLLFDSEKQEVKFVRRPNFTEIPYDVPMDIVAIIEFYSR